MVCQGRGVLRSKEAIVMGLDEGLRFQREVFTSHPRNNGEALSDFASGLTISDLV